MNHYRKLMILAINHLLESGAITLRDEEVSPGHVFVDIAGRPSVVLWASIGHGELRVSVWWDYDHSKHPQANLTGSFRESFDGSAPLAKRAKYPLFVGVTASGWLERKTGKWLMGKGSERLVDTYSRKGTKGVLDAMLNPTPAGYAPEGGFIF